MLALGIRAELFQPAAVLHPEFFNSLTSMHGLIMVFGAIMPAFVGFANWQVPMMIGAPDMAFAAHEQLELLLCRWRPHCWSRRFRAGRRGRGRLDHYAPLSTQMGRGGLGIFALHIMGASSIMGRSTSSPPSSTCARPG